MRPDLNSWQYTNQLTTVRFSPRRLLSGQLLGWILRLLAFQVAFSILLWLALYSAPAVVDSWPASRSAEIHQRLRASFQAASKAVVTQDGIWSLCLLLAGQFGALLLLHLFFIPRMRRRLAEHGQGVKQVLDGIRNLADGGTPKPLATGSGGEVGYLAVAFNDMAVRLMASRRALLEANQSLERRVDERTQELRDATIQLQKMASTDALTGLANRRHFHELSLMMFSESIRRETDLVCMMIDLDNFKTINDTLGHKAGDDLLCVTAEVLRSAARSEDLVARLGGDEFIVLMPMADVGVARQIAERLQDEFARCIEPLLAGHQLPKRPSLSVGLSSRKLCQAESLAEVVSSADDALYQAKGGGKRTVFVYNPTKSAA